MKTQKALLLIDIQNDYFEGSLNPLSGSMEAGLNAQKLLQHFRSQSLPVVHVQHISTRQDATFFLPDTKGSEIHNCVAPLERENIIIKHVPNSFYQTELHEMLQSLGITELIICGMMTHMCVDATVRAAKDLGYKCIVIHDACATKDLEFQGVNVEAEKVQTAFLAALTPFYSVLASAEEYSKENF